MKNQWTDKSRKQPPLRLTAALDTILKQADRSPISIKDITLGLADKGYAIMIALFSIPFCFPIQIPGLSTPFGILLAFLGLRLIFSKSIWLPHWLGQKKIPYSTLQDMVQKTRPYLLKIEKILHPRWLFLTQNSALHVLYGLLIAFLGFFLALPLPIPFTNMLCAVPLLAFGLGLLADDGVFVFCALCLSLISFACFSILIWLSHTGLAAIF